MKFEKLAISGAFIVTPEKREDERGFFARIFCEEEFRQHGLETSFCQMNTSLSKQKGTLRGLHYQLSPFEECKVVRCIQGSVFDVVLDLRLDSNTFGKYVGVTLSADNGKMMVVPRGCAHGFLTLEEGCEVSYLVSNIYSKEKERGIRYNDPAFSIEWLQEVLVISERDKAHPNFCVENACVSS